MVNHNQNRIRAISGRQQIGDEIHRRMGKEPNIIGGRHRHEHGASGMTINLEALALKTASNVRFNKRVETRPVVRAGDSSNRGENTRMTSDSGVMVELQNLAAEAKVSRDVLPSVEIQRGNIVGEGSVPVGVGLGIRKNALSKGIGGITIRDRALEIQVDKRNKKIVGQHSNVVVIIFYASRMIRLAGEHWREPF